MIGMDFIQNTEFGKELSKRLPPKVTRIIIDIRPCDEITIYYETKDSELYLYPNWKDILPDIKIVGTDSDKKINADRKGSEKWNVKLNLR